MPSTTTAQPASAPRIPADHAEDGIEGTRGHIALFEAADANIRLEVRLERDTVWLSQAQMVELFQRDQSVISRHTRNVFREGELDSEGNMQKVHIASADRPVTLYSLDVVISVGYRVKSPQGTRFRIWATHTLKDHLIRGYTLNEQRLRERGLKDLNQSAALLAKTLTLNGMITDEGLAVLEVVQSYTRAWTLLLAYDEDRLTSAPARPKEPAATLGLRQARISIGRLRAELALRNEATELFGLERGEQLGGILGSIEQTFDGKAVYPSAQERGAHLLYFVIKDHPFADGNKRIGVLLFLEYLRLNDLLLLQNGAPRLSENAVVALALLVAESEPGHKSLMIRLILNLLESDERPVEH